MAIPAGTVYLDVKPNMTTFAPGVQSGVSGSKGKLSSAAKSLGLVMGAAFAVSYGKAAFADFEESEAVTAALGNRLKEMGQKGRPTADTLLAMNDELSKMSGIDDELISKGTTLLATFGNIRNEQGKNNDIFTQANSLMVDYASQFTGGNMESAATQLGKALDNPIKGMTALSRVGVSFTDQQTKLITKLYESGDALGAQKVILEAVRPQVEGAAEANATLGDKASVAMGNFKEAIGSLIAQGIGPLLSALTPVITFFAESPALTGLLIAGILALVVAYKLWAAWTALTTAAQATLLAAMPWVAIGVAVVALVVLIVKNWDKIKAFLLGVFNKVKAAGIAVWNALKAAGLAIWNVLKAAVIAYFNVYKAIFNGIKAVGLAVWNALKSGFNAFKGALISGFNAVKSVGMGIWDAIKGAAIAVWNAIASAWNNSVGSLSFSVPSWIPGIGGNTYDVPDIPMAQEGGLITKTGIIMAHAGELIGPIEKVQGNGGGRQFISGELTLTPDGRAFVRGVVREETDLDRRWQGGIGRMRGGE